ncbi:hypothetical protein AVEN_135613-1 [Araneus ventricosus]|uniref:Uncharacterized protein n=1 Tax=Araneus ventricosus TaxID=182803 RepID=A0A4Y2DQV2_ARAVE|nr:hypothetical protein AVEN_135613-1 [Araneus ventricosus]
MVEAKLFPKFLPILNDPLETRMREAIMVLSIIKEENFKYGIQYPANKTYTHKVYRQKQPVITVNAYVSTLDLRLREICVNEMWFLSFSRKGWRLQISTAAYYLGITSPTSAFMNTGCATK